MRLSLLLLASITGLWAQSERALVRSTGVPDLNGTAVYGVFVASRGEALENVIVSAAIPAGARFLESLDVPKGGTYEGVQDNTILWRFPRLERDTLLGPFNFRVKPDGSGQALTDTVLAAVGFERPTAELIESPAPVGQLKFLTTEGSITVDERGTLNDNGENKPVAVGETGIRVFVPAGAVGGKATLAFTRQPVETLVPPKDGTWWCSGFRVGITDGTSNTVTPTGTTGGSRRAVTFSSPVVVETPARRPLPPGITGTSSYIEQDNLASPTILAVGGSRAGFGFGGGGFQQFGCGVGFGTGFGLGCAVGFGGGLCQFNCSFGFGVDAVEREVAQISGTRLSELLGKPITAADYLDRRPSLEELLQR
jgi:hypothetical protein